MLVGISNLPAIFTRLCLSPAGRAFLLSLSCWLLAFTYCRFRFWRDPHSAFFDGSDHAYEFKYSSFRTKQGLQHLDDLARQITTPRKLSSHSEICAAFVTIRREGTQYVDAAIGSMVEGLTDWERARLDVKVLFTDPNPSDHPTWTQPWLKEAVDWAGTYKVTEDEHKHLSQLMEEHRWTEKGVL